MPWTAAAEARTPASVPGGSTSRGYTPSRWAKLSWWLRVVVPAVAGSIRRSPSAGITPIVRAPRLSQPASPTVEQWTGGRRPSTPRTRQAPAGRRRRNARHSREGPDTAGDRCRRRAAGGGGALCHHERASAEGHGDAHRTARARVAACRVQRWPARPPPSPCPRAARDRPAQRAADRRAARLPFARRLALSRRRLVRAAAFRGARRPRGSHRGVRPDRRRALRPADRPGREARRRQR